MVSRLASWSGKLVSSVQSLSCVPLLWTHGLQHTRLLCPSPTPGACSNSCPLSRWCNPTVSSSVVLFCFQSFPAWGSFQMSQLFTSGGQSIGVSASASVLPMNIQWLISFRIDWFDPLAVRDSQESSPTPQFKSINSSVISFLHGPILTSIHDYWKNHSLTRQTFVGKAMSLLFNMLSSLVMAFLPRSKCLLGCSHRL